MITMDEKIHELYYTLKPKCEAEHLNHFWEIHKALRRFVKRSGTGNCTRTSNSFLYSL